jgi:hypothetical protein
MSMGPEQSTPKAELSSACRTAARNKHSQGAGRRRGGGSVQIPSPRLSPEAKSRRRSRKPRAAGLELFGTPVSSHASAIAFYLEQYHQGRGDEAFDGLLELEHGALPDLANAFRRSTDTSVRTFLLNAIWQHRQPGAIPLLADALFDAEPQIWQEAMNGLVALASPESLEALRRARTRQFANDRESQRFSGWLEEAIGQAEFQLPS